MRKPLQKMSEEHADLVVPLPGNTPTNPQSWKLQSRDVRQCDGVSVPWSRIFRIDELTGVARSLLT